ncbi:MAG: biotin--[acetyl-CoA-carboxylase] ligase [Thermincola sp.]|jgi:BirA family biotin operon repressor/biotin-[acetyl-CoA-carboxylase] ligase|nr:biotin--[acetyl-CoA-carboxylase] ligase [Thermincola sp.]MDT3702164.1 biotin--[acetyl-CoA-carboxylase] ligase [Thermincola sp.]
MKSKILALLRESDLGFISGQEISRRLGISRTAVWKHIRSLKEGGYNIESHSKIGYRLIETPDRLYGHELISLLNGMVFGRQVIYRETVVSTNELAKELARKEAEEGTVVIAEEQTGGKGRMERVWYSPPGQGLWFSTILRPVIKPVDASKLTLVSAVAVAKTIREVADIPAGIKWPNDVLVNQRKVAGILIEMSAEIDRINYLVLGIGVNVSLDGTSIPGELANVATSLEAENKLKVTRVELLAALLNNLDKLYEDFLAGKFKQILNSWKEMSVTLNRRVKVISGSEVEEGVASDLDEDGALVLLKSDGSRKRILSGDVSVR